MNILRNMVRRSASLLLELPCEGCGTAVAAEVNSLCPRCREKLAAVPEPRCPYCGGVNQGILRCCPDCLEAGERPWSAAKTLFLYEGLARQLILEFKFSGHTGLAALFAELAAPEVAGFGRGFDFIVPVPLHWLRRLRRGYNQCELFGRELSRRTGIPFADVLRRTGLGGHQSRRDRAERLAAMRGAFRLKNRRVADKNLLLVDDVFTTGATLTAAAGVLASAGAATVAVLTLARRA